MIKSRGHKLILLFLLQFCMGISAAFGQGNLLYYNKVDTLSFWNRFNLRTNFVDWITLTPNVGVEFAVGNKNWNRWTVGAYGRFNWNTNTKENTYYLYDLYGGRLEVRKYWHARIPKRVFYLGIYGGINKFDIKLDEIGRNGQSFVGGLTLGTITQLYGYQNGASLDFDLGINAGVVFAKYYEYRRELLNDKYVYTKTKPEDGYKLTFSPLIYTASTDVLRVALVYHFGTKLSNKYKKRLLIDNDYRIALEVAKIRRDSLNAVEDKRKREVADSLEKIDYEKRFEEQHLELEKKYREDSLRVINQALKVEADKAKAEAKRTADSLKVVNKEKAIEEKANAKRMADSLKVVNREKAEEAERQKAIDKANAKRVADSLDVVRKKQAQEADLAKEERKEESERENNSLEQINETGEQDVIKEQEEEKEQKKEVEENATKKEEEQGNLEETPQSPVPVDNSSENNSGETDNTGTEKSVGSEDGNNEQ